MLDAKASKSDLALINHASSSGDPRVRALGLAFELATSERGSAVAIAFEELADGGSPQEVLVAARYLGRQSDDAIQRKLKEQEASAGHGAKWPLAVALAESGSVGALRAWGEHGAKEVAFGGRNARRILRLAGLYPHDDVMGIAVAASRSADVVLRRAAVRVLGAGSTQAARDALHALRQDADEGVRTAAIDAVRRQSGKADSGGAER